MYSKIAFRNVRKSFKDFTVYFITLLLGVCIFYAFNSISSQAASLDMNDAQQLMMTLLGIAMKGISFVVAIILGFLIIYANRYLIKRRKAEFAVYLTLGMERSKVSLIIVIETLLVGILSLVCGIVLGVLVSQGMLFITAGMFSMDVSTFNLVFSGDACIATIIYFAIIFLVALIFNVATISRYKLINLINATKHNEVVVLRNMRVAVALFVLSVVLIGVAYWQLISAGIATTSDNNNLTLCAVLILVGTVLFFYSSGTFLLRAFQSRKKLYYKGVNMFVLRQISSRINTAFVSVSVVCIALFLAIVCVCLGFGLSASLNQALKDATKYDATLSFDVEMTEEAQSIMSMFGVEVPVNEAAAQAAADGYNMQAALEREVPAAAALIDEAAQVNYYQTSATYADLGAVADEGAKSFFSEAEAMTMFVVKVSDVNKLRAMNGEDALDLASGECLFWTDVNQAQTAFAKFGSGKSLVIDGKTYTFAKDALVKTAAKTSLSPSNNGTLVVADDALPQSAKIMNTTLDINLKVTGGAAGDGEGAGAGSANDSGAGAAGSASDKSGGAAGSKSAAGSSAQSREESMDAFKAAIEEAVGQSSSVWPVGSNLTAKDAKAWSSGFSAIIAYLAIYIGLVLMVACAAILALQQLTEALDSAHRYNMLSKIGADGHMLNAALLRQIGAYFFYPFVLAVAHACLLCWALKDVFNAFGMSDMVSSVGGTIGIVLAIYVVYFLITYLAARAIVFSRQIGRTA